MTSIFDKLNLQPHERRFVVIGTVVLLLLLNYLVIIPYFKEWDVVRSEIEKTDTQNAKFKAEIDKKSLYEKRIAELKKNEGANILDLPENERATYVSRKIQETAEENSVTWNNLRPVASLSRGLSGQTNQFFDEIIYSIDVNAGEAELVNFLYQLGKSEAMIRVRGMNNLGLDPSQRKLKTTLTLVSSFQRKTPLPAAKPVSTTNKPPVKAVPPAGSTTAPTKSVVNRVVTNAPAKVPSGTSTNAAAASKTNKFFRK
jgi:Tfp pilus assembly protein PilO